MPGLISYDRALDAIFSLSGEVVATKASNETPTVTGLSGELLTNVVCEDGICRLTTNTTSSQALKEELVEGLDKNFTKTD